MTTISGQSWFDGRECAVSLTFDDGMPSQLRRAVPYMNRLGLRGTFYLNPRETSYREELVRWREVLAAGHEIGNHTTRHPCTGAIWDDGYPEALEKWTLAEIEADILLAEQRLYEILPGLGPHTFCYPCYNHHVGSGTARQSYTHIVAKHFVAGRGGAPNRGACINPSACDLSYLEASPAELMRGYEMIGLVERAAARGRWVIFVFHGVGEGWLPVTEPDFQELCDHLHRHRGRLWTAPVAEVARHIAARRGMKLPEMRPPA